MGSNPVPGNERLTLSRVHAVVASLSFVAIIELGSVGVLSGWQFAAICFFAVSALLNVSGHLLETVHRDFNLTSPKSLTVFLSLYFVYLLSPIAGIGCLIGHSSPIFGLIFINLGLLLLCFFADLTLRKSRARTVQFKALTLELQEMNRQREAGEIDHDEVRKKLESIEQAQERLDKQDIDLWVPRVAKFDDSICESSSQKGD